MQCIFIWLLESYQQISYSREQAKYAKQRLWLTLLHFLSLYFFYLPDHLLPFFSIVTCQNVKSLITVYSQNDFFYVCQFVLSLLLLLFVSLQTEEITSNYMYCVKHTGKIKLTARFLMCAPRSTLCSLKKRKKGSISLEIFARHDDRAYIDTVVLLFIICAAYVAVFFLQQ